jgi:ferredoxin
MAKIIHDRVRCQSIGVCEAMAPENFEFNDANEMTVLRDGTVSDEQLDQVREAVAGCPNEALALLDDDPDLARR